MSNESPLERLLADGAQPTAAHQDNPNRGGAGPDRGGSHELAAILQAAPAAMFIAHDSECSRITRSRIAHELPWTAPGSANSSRSFLAEQAPRCRLFRGDEELASPESLLQQAVGGVEVQGVELGIVFQDCAETHLYGSAAPLLDETGSPQGAVAVFVDISQLKRENARMTAQVQDLARSNAELERFASTISHDLRSPLMSLTGCAQLLLQRHADQLPPQGRTLIADIQNGAREMTQLIKCLRDYARAGHGELRMTNCPAELLLDSALKSLHSDLMRSAARVTVDPLPRVTVDETLVAQLLQNLIENALKYRGTSTPCIHVSAGETPSHWVISVRDNGIGIDPQDYDRIFQAFERLRPNAAQTSGLGIGLAICKRIAERHGGRLWVESQPGLGTTFYFSLAR